MLNLHSYASGLQYFSFRTSRSHISKALDCGATASVHFSLQVVVTKQQCVNLG